jgi:hypothetical protein
MQQISVGKSTTLANVNSWLLNDSSDLHFRLTRDSDLLPFAEGPALNAIAALRDRARIHVSTAFDLDFRSQSVDLDCLSTIFGLQLLYYSVDVKDSAGRSLRSELLKVLWQRVVEGGGSLGSGAGRYIFFRDPDYVVPPCLRRETARDISPGNRFLSVLKETAVSFGAGKGFGNSKTETALLTFLYEAATNANDHGARPAIGVRGITARKLIFHTEEDLVARELPVMLKEYCSRTWSNRKDSHFIISFTVSDLGPGIQNTLRPIEGESEPNRLLRAFKSGESSKPTGTDTARGQGLTRILEAASAIQALLIITSARRLIYRDFSSEATVDESGLIIHPNELSVSAGTSLTLLWAPPRSSPDQQSLPLTD